MPPGNDWVIDFFIEDNGKDPVNEFIDNLPLKVQAKIEADIEYLRLYNGAARPPKVEKITDRLWYIRTRADNNAYRTFYFTLTGKRIVLLHIFIKKTSKTPPKEIQIAERRLDMLLRREAKERQR